MEQKVGKLCGDTYAFSGGISSDHCPNPNAKGVMEFAKKNDNLKVIGAVVNNQLLSPKEIDKLSKLPSLDELRGKIVGLLQAPATKIAAVLQAPAGCLARVVAAYGAKQ